MRVNVGKKENLFNKQYTDQIQRCWLENMTSEEPLLFVLYDSMEGPQARCMLNAYHNDIDTNNSVDCPHISIHNPRANPKAEKRRSIETRSIIISKITE